MRLPRHARRERWSGLLALVRRFWPLVARERSIVVGSLLAVFAEVALRLLEPWPLKFVFDRLIPVGAAPATELPMVGVVPPTMLLTLAALALVLIIGLRALASYLSTVGFALAGNRVLTEVRGELYRHLQSLSLAFHHRARQGDLTLRVIGDVGALKDVIVTALLPLLANVLILAGMLAMMFLMEWRLALIAVAVLPVFLLFAGRQGRRIGEASRVQRQREGALAATAAESVAAIKVVKALSLEKAFASNFSSDNRRTLADGVRVRRLSAGLERTVDLLTAVATALVLWAGARLVLDRVLTPGDLLVFLSYLKSAFKPIQELAKYAGRIAKGSAAAERVLDVLDRSPDVRNSAGAVRAPALLGGVRLDDVHFAYEEGGDVLKGVSLEVLPGQRVALTGPSGGGKSTLLSLLLRLYNPSSGRVMFDSHDIRAFTIDSIRDQIAVVLQDTVLFAASVRENIAYGASDASDADIEAAARLASAHTFIAALPGGYDAVVGERGVTLSGGQRQRIAIARAAVRRAPLLILDEPTAGLDEANASSIIDALQRVARRQTTFMATHDPRLAASADVVLYIEGGVIVEQGRPADLACLDGPYASLQRTYAADAHWKERRVVEAR